MSLRCKECDKFEASKTPSLKCRCGSAPRKWQADLTVRGRRCYQTAKTAMTPREARAWYQALKAPTPDSREHVRQRTFREAAALYLREREAAVGAEIRQSTHEDSESHVRLYLLPYFGGWRLEQIGIAEVKQFKATLREGLPAAILQAKLSSARARLSVSGFKGDLEARMAEERARILSRPLSGATVRKVMVTLQAVLSRAIQERWIGFNPVREVSKTVKNAAKRTGIALTPEETSQLDAVLESFDERHRLPLRLQLRLGLRKGEAVALQWEDFDREAGTLTIQRSLRDGRIEAPKTAAGIRTIPLPTDLAEQLWAWRRKLPILPGGWMFPARSRGKAAQWLGVQNAFNFGRAWARAKAALLARIDNEQRAKALSGLRMHDLRHTAITNFARRGVDAFVTKALVGHGNERMTQYYTHASLEDMRCAVGETAAKPLRG